MSGEVPLGLVKMVNDLTTLYSEDYGQRSVITSYSIHYTKLYDMASGCYKDNLIASRE